MYLLSHSNSASGRRNSFSSNSSNSSNNTTNASIPSSNSRGWLAYMLKKTVVHHQQQDIKLEEERMSMVFSVLPTSIKNRLPPIRSLRKTVSSPIWAASAPITSPATATTPPTLMSPFCSRASTPVSEAETAVMDVSMGGDADMDQTPGFDGFAFSNAQNLASSMTMFPPSATSETGINWRCGGQGFNLILSSAQESRSRHSSNYNSTFERTSYVDGVQYMLQGLPRDLDPTEAVMLRRAMPPALVECLPPCHAHDPAAAAAPSHITTYHNHSASSKQQERNLIHSTLFFLLMYLQNWIVWVTPYVLEFSGEVLRLERQHRVAETLAGKLVTAMSWGIQAARGFSDGPLGQCLSSLLEYMAQGVSGALQEFARNEFARKGFEARRGTGTGDVWRGERGDGRGTETGRRW